MAASDTNPHSDRPQPSALDCIAPAALTERLEEEISRAERHGTQLSCLLVVIENLDEMAREHGSELRDQTLEYVAQALRRELRRFDRIGRSGPEHGGSDNNLLIILPGADGPRAESVGRRVLERLRTIKVEAQGARFPLQVSVGLAGWHEDLSAQTLLAQARAALRPINGNGENHVSAHTDAPAQGVETTPAPSADVQGSLPPAFGRAGRS
ncbi:MAG: diguanylate cyclase [Solirubrobacteraceae bacterium]|jgi:diguanylate cyclase (GGDEF)-like protein